MRQSSHYKLKLSGRNHSLETFKKTHAIDINNITLSCVSGVLLFAVGCKVPPPPNAMPTSRGFTPEGGAVHFGTEASIEMVKGIDSAWAAFTELMPQIKSSIAGQIESIIVDKAVIIN